MRKRGFTLVELLVVIAIIAILAAMIMPVLLEAKDAARMKRCLSNIRQLGSSLTMYMDDHSGFGLPVDRTPTTHAYDNPWILFVKPLQSYLGQAVFEPRSLGITGYQPPNVTWVCQGDRLQGPPDDTNNRPCWWHWGSSYMYPGPTAYISPSPVSPTNVFTKDAGVLPRKPMTWLCPRRDILLADYWFDFHSGYRVEKHVNAPAIKWMNGQGKGDVKCINVLFLDMHAAAVTPLQRNDLIQNVRYGPPFGDNPY